MVRGSLKSKMIGAFIVFMSLGLLTYVVLDKRGQPIQILSPATQPPAVHQPAAIPVPKSKPTYQPAKQWHPKPEVAKVVQHQPKLVKPIVAKPVSHKTHHAALPKPGPVAHVYWLQVASYHALQNARLMRRRLLLLGYPSRIKVVHVHGVSWYRLSAGPFASQRRARLAQRNIRRKWKLKTHIRVTKG